MDFQLVIVCSFFLIMLLITYKHVKKNGIIKLGSLILITYTFSVFCSIYLINDSLFTHFHDITIMPYIYWLIMFLIICQPLFIFDKLQINIVKYNINIIKIICIVGFLVSVIPFYEQLIHAREFIISANLAEKIADTHDYRSDADIEVFLSPLGQALLHIVNGLFNIAILFIYPLIKEKEKNKLVWLGLALVVLTANFQSLLYASRGKATDTIFKFTLFVCLFYPMMEKKMKKNLIKIVGFIGGIIVVLFLIISLSRTSQYQEHNSQYSTVHHFAHYIGEGTMLFNENLPHLKQHTNGDYCFYYVKMLGETEPKVLSRESRIYFENYLGIKMMVFYTFLGFFVIDIGWLGTFLFWSIIALLMCYFLRRSVKIQYSKFNDFTTNKVCIMRLSDIYIIFLFAAIILNGFTVYQYSFAKSFAYFHYLAMYIVLRIFKM